MISNYITNFFVIFFNINNFVTKIVDFLIEILPGATLKCPELIHGQNPLNFTIKFHNDVIKLITLLLLHRAAELSSPFIFSALCSSKCSYQINSAKELWYYNQNKLSKSKSKVLNFFFTKDKIIFVQQMINTDLLTCHRDLVRRGCYYSF